MLLVIHSINSGSTTESGLSPLNRLEVIPVTLETIFINL